MISGEVVEAAEIIVSLFWAQKVSRAFMFDHYAVYILFRLS